MRTIIDTLVALMLAGVLAGVVMHHRARDEDDQRAEAARDVVQMIQREIILKGSLGAVETTRQGYPTTIDPKWFGESLPTNPLLADNRPWMEVAGHQQRGLDHPDVRIALTPNTAAFWYNPYKGIVRARVPATISDSAALSVYNFVNGSELTALLPNAAGRGPHLRADDARAAAAASASLMASATPSSL